MNRYGSRVGLGALAGVVGSLVLAVASGQVLRSAVLGVLVGAGYAIIFRPAKRNYLDSSMTAAAMGVALWGLVSVVATPLLAGRGPEWTAAEMRIQFPALVGWVLYGATLGLLLHALCELSTKWFGPELATQETPPAVNTRILILGGGFAGVTAVAELEQLFGADPSVTLTLVSNTNALLFTPMLAEVAGGSLEPSHISAPLRTSLRRTQMVRGRVAHIDLDGHCVRLARDERLACTPDLGEDEGGAALKYDHLVLALGSVPQYFGSDEIQTHALAFKSLADAIHIRNHVIGQFERADRELDPALRQAMLTFVVAGGGFAGSELAGSLNDFARGMLAFYPNVPLDEVRIVLVHARERILPELSEPLAAYALRQMTARGVTFRLNTRVLSAQPGVVVLQSGAEIKTETFVWTAGTMPNPLLAQLPVTCDERGAVLVDANLGVPGRPGVWACGDCAAVPDGLTGKKCPPTAQFAMRQASQLARNLFASVRGKPLKRFRFNTLGMLCVVGYHTACAEIKGLRFAGFFAWLLWRGVYLSKLPGWERKLRVSVDWIIELFFPRDIVQTGDLGGED